MDFRKRAEGNTHWPDKIPSALLLCIARAIPKLPTKWAVSRSAPHIESCRATSRDAQKCARNKFKVGLVAPNSLTKRDTFGLKNPEHVPMGTCSGDIAHSERIGRDTSLFVVH